jgi:hypothetical protein
VNIQTYLSLVERWGLVVVQVVVQFEFPQEEQTAPACGKLSPWRKHR